jgi:hypothetical protein
MPRGAPRALLAAPPTNVRRRRRPPDALEVKVILSNLCGDINIALIELKLFCSPMAGMGWVWARAGFDARRGSHGHTKEP